MKQFLCTCESPDYEGLGLKDVNDLIDFVDEAKEITSKEFLEDYIDGKELKIRINEFPNDFVFYKNNEIIFYTHSCIEHFYKWKKKMKCKNCGSKIRRIRQEDSNEYFCSTDCSRRDYDRIIKDIQKLKTELEKYHKNAKWN